MAASALLVENGVGFQHTPHEVVTGDEKVCGEDSSSNFAVTAGANVSRDRLDRFG
jgi:hypothetical protein